jgi:uncharacterized protein (DUF305 family)
VTAVLEPNVDQPVPPAENDEGGEHWWHSPWKLLALGVALLFFGFAAGYALTSRDDTPGAGSVDVGFLQDMRWHHDQAVLMAYTYLRKPSEGLDPQLRTIAGEILLGQQLESGRMAQMLRTFHQPEANMTGTGMAWMNMAVPIARMPGMANDDELHQLDAASGRDADIIFTKLMTAHHEGGVHMADYASAHAKDGEVKALAQAISSSQRDEIAELNQVLARLNG